MSVTESYSDQDILEGIRTSNKKIEKAFYQQNYNMIRGLVYKYNNSGSIGIDDLYQEVMVVVFMKVKNNELTNLTAKLSTYVYQTALNILRYRLRSDSRMRKIPLEGQDFVEEIQSDINKDILEIAALELYKKLSYPCKEIIEDWYIHKLDYDQIAIKYKYKNANTAKKKKGDCISNARVEARKLLEKTNQ